MEHFYETDKLSGTWLGLVHLLLSYKVWVITSKWCKLKWVLMIVFIKGAVTASFNELMMYCFQEASNWKFCDWNESQISVLLVPSGQMFFYWDNYLKSQPFPKIPVDI